MLDKDKMTENHLEGSVDIESVVRMEFTKINFPLIFFPHEGISTACFLLLLLLFCFTGNHTGCDLQGR